MKMHYTLSILFLYINGVHGQLEIDKSNWVNPHDMLQNRGGKLSTAITKCQQELENLSTMLKECRGSIAVAETGHTNTGDCSAWKQNLYDCTSQLKHTCNNAIAPLLKETGNGKIELLFVRRYVNHLLKYMLYEGKAMEYFMKVKLSTEDYATLTEFIDEKTSNLQDVDHVLTKMISNVYSPDELEGFRWILKDYQMCVLVGILLIVLCLLPMLYRICCWCVNHYFLSSGLVVIVASWVWNFIRLYKEALARKAAAMEQNSRVPVECYPESMSWFQTIRATFSREDKCYTYHRTVMVDAIYDVNPVTAVADMFYSQFTTGLKALGSGFGLFYNAFLNELPFFLGLPLLVLLMIMLGFMLLVMCGYQFRVWPFISIGPADRARHQAHPPLHQVGPPPPPQAVIHHIADTQHTRDLLAMLTNQRIHLLPPTPEIAVGAPHNSEVPPPDTPALAVPPVREGASSVTSLSARALSVNSFTERVGEINHHDASTSPTQPPSRNIFKTAFEAVCSLNIRQSLRDDVTPPRDLCEPISGEILANVTELEEQDIRPREMGDSIDESGPAATLNRGFCCHQSDSCVQCKACGGEEEGNEPRDNELNRLLEKCSWPRSDDEIEDVRNQHSGVEYVKASGDRKS